MDLVGKTIEEYPVASGVFYYKDTLGLPWDVIISKMVEKNIIIDWEGVVKDAIKQKYPIDKLIDEIVEAFLQGALEGKVYGGETIDVPYISRLEFGLSKLFVKAWREKDE